VRGGGGYGKQHSEEVNYVQLKKHRSQQSLHAFAKQKKKKKRLPKLDAAIAEVQEAKARIVDMDCSLVSRDQQNELVDLIMKNVHVWKVNLKRRYAVYMCICVYMSCVKCKSSYIYNHKYKHIHPVASKSRKPRTLPLK
jgi:hypothetical protein